MGIAIGIDLGTTNSAVSVLRDGKVEVVRNRLDEEITPSVVALERDSDALITGRPAKELLALAPGRAAAWFKRSMGSDRAYPIGSDSYGAIELSAILLRALKEDASRGIGEDVSACVVTVPAYFSEEQRYATVKAAELAGLDVLRILNEPTAAAMAYGMHEREREATFLVFDLGGGTFDVCVMELFDGVLQVLSTAGESRLGGEDFTRRLVGLALHEAGHTYERVEMSQPAAFATLLKRCELAKRHLSDAYTVEVVVPPMAGRIDKPLPLTLAREEVERVWQPLLRRLEAPCRAALRGARLDASDLSAVLLVGGATRMPAVRKFAAEYFEIEPSSDIDPDLAVVRGAAVQAALCERDAAVEDMVVTDVLSHSLGVEVAKKLGGQYIDGYFTPIIHRNTVIPTSRTMSFQTLDPNQREMDLSVYEGESRRIEENRLIGNMSVKGIPRGPAGQRVDVTFTYDVNGLLEVEAKVEATGKAVSRIFSRSSRTVSEADLKRARERMAKLKEDPQSRPLYRDLMLRAEGLWQELPPDAREFLGHAIHVFEESLASRNPQEIREAYRELKDICDRIDGGKRW